MEHLEIRKKSSIAVPEIIDIKPMTVDPPSEKTTSTIKKTKKCDKKKSNNTKEAIGSHRGIETMFRNAYRAQLDLIALAATKANIMISLNGLILSVLTISSPFILVSEPMLMIPSAAFVATCLLSIIYAVLSARPRVMKSNPTLDDFKNDTANPLQFEEFSHLSTEQHVVAMGDMMCTNRRIYENMTRQLHYFGKDADKKFKLLHISYTVFMVGLTISSVLLLVTGALYKWPELIPWTQPATVG